MNDINTNERYYVYALIDPQTETPFYIGKGTNNRIKNHFMKIESNDEVNIIDYVEEDEYYDYSNENTLSEKSKKITELFSMGYEFNDIARIIATNITEVAAFAIEAVLIKSVYGFNNLTNMVQGQHHERFRKYNDWSLTPNLDYFNNDRKKPTSREPLLKSMIKEQYHLPLIKAASMIDWLCFDKPKILDAGELGIEADYLGTRIKIGIRKQIYVEIRPRRKAHKEWMKAHFQELGLSSYLRKDCVFNVPLGKGRNRIILTIDQLVERVESFKRILDAKEYDELTEFDINMINSIRKK